MDETSPTLLNAIRACDEQERWAELVNLYTPFIRSIVIGCGTKGADVDDVVQNTLSVVVQRLPDFDRRRTGSFRTWLRAITVNSMRKHWRSKPNTAKSGDGSESLLDELEDPNSELTQYWNQEHNRHVLEYLLDRARVEFRETTWRAFHALAIEHQPVEQVAAQLEITANAAFIARSRVMKRLKELGAEILE